MNNEIFEFDDNRFKEQIFNENKLYNKIKFCIKYLENYLPTNEVNKDNTFDFDKLKVREGKNYNWYFLNNNEIKLLIRQYNTHFTIFVYKIDHKHDSLSNISQFNIYVDNALIPDELNDDYVNNEFLSFEKILPQIFQLVKENKIGLMWNPLILKREDFIKIEVGFIGEERIQSIDKTIFACDEIFEKYLELFAENEMFEKIKTLKVGDMFSAYKVTKIQTKLVDEYYHAIGLSYINTNFPDSNESWGDVYSLTRYHYNDLFKDINLKKVSGFVYTNHDEVFTEVYENLKDVEVFFKIRKMINSYLNIMFEKFVKQYSGIIYDDFVKSLPEGFENFIEHNYRKYEANN